MAPTAAQQAMAEPEMAPKTGGLAPPQWPGRLKSAHQGGAELHQPAGDAALGHDIAGQDKEGQGQVGKELTLANIFG